MTGKGELEMLIGKLGSDQVELGQGETDHEMSPKIDGRFFQAG